MHSKDETKNLFVELYKCIVRVILFITPSHLLTKVLLTTAATLYLSTTVSNTPGVKIDKDDVLVYCAIYCTWAVFFMPDILLRLSTHILGKVFGVVVRLFGAELLAFVYMDLKGEIEYSEVLKRAVSLQPLLEPDHQWLEEFANKVRLVLIVGCLSASMVAHLFDRPEILMDCCG